MHTVNGPVSTRLVQVLRTYCYGLEGEGVSDLRDSLEAGRYPWFAEEFAAALTFRAFTPSSWAACVGEAESPPVISEITAMRRTQDQLWMELFPGLPSPVYDV